MKFKLFDQSKTSNRSPSKGWFYTNERLEKLLIQKDYFKNTKNIFTIGAGGDFSFSFLSLYGDEVNQVQSCDNRDISDITQNLKSTIIKNLEWSTTRELFSGRLSDEAEVCDYLLPQTKKETQTVIKNLLEKTKQVKFIRALKYSKLWQGDSFWQIKEPEQYLGYLTTEERYFVLQKNLKKIQHTTGDFFNVLESFPDDYFDLIYTSNIFDSPEFHDNSDLYLKRINKKLSNKGKFISCNIKSQKKMSEVVVSGGNFTLLYKEIHSFSFLSALQGHYDYSYFVYQKKLLN